MFRAVVAFFFLIEASSAARADTLAGPISAEVVKVIDGDTIKVRATIWLDQTVVVSVRLRGIDAPELYRPKCEAEKVLAKSAKDSVVSSTPAGSLVTLTDISRDKYGGRVVASVTTARGETLSSQLLARGEAIPIGGPKPWCGA